MSPPPAPPHTGVQSVSVKWAELAHAGTSQVKRCVFFTPDTVTVQQRVRRAVGGGARGLVQDLACVGGFAGFVRVHSAGSGSGVGSPPTPTPAHASSCPPPSYPSSQPRNLRAALNPLSPRCQRTPLPITPTPPTQRCFCAEISG